MKIVVESGDLRSEVDVDALLRDGRHTFSVFGLKFEFDDDDAFHIDSDRGSLFLVVDSELGFANFTYSGYDLMAYIGGGTAVIEMKPYRLYITDIQFKSSGDVRALTLGMSERNMVKIEIDKFRLRRVETRGYVDLMALSGSSKFELYYGDLVLTLEEKRRENTSSI